MLASTNIVDAQDSLLDARLIKSPDEVQLMKTSASMADAAYDTLVRSIRPGVKENELVGLVCQTLYSLGSDDVECVNVVSGPRSAPHPHVFSDRIIRPGDFVFFDIIHSFNGYRTCYYRSFICGRPTDDQKAAYKQAYDWLYQAIDMVKPGVTSKEIALSWPECTTWGLSTGGRSDWNGGGATELACRSTSGRSSAVFVPSRPPSPCKRHDHCPGNLCTDPG